MTGYVLQRQLTKGHLINRYPQMILEGHIVSFDWLNPSKVSVDWFVGGYGKYDLATRDGVPSPASSGNITVDIYFNGWVQVYSSSR